MPAAASYNYDIDDPLSLAPPRVILAFIRGCWAASIIVVLVVIVSLAPRFPQWSMSWTRWSLPPLALLWVGAVAWLTPAFLLPQAAMRGFSRRSALRRFARLLQWGWLAAAVLRLLRYELRWTGSAGAMANVGMIIGFIVGLAGVVILAVLMERLANWARDGGAEKAFNFAAFTIPLATLLLVFGIPFLPAALFGRFGPVVMLSWLIAVGAFPYALLSLAGSVTLSVVHNYEHRQRQERRADRQQRHEDQVARTIETMDAERGRRGHV